MNKHLRRIVILVIVFLSGCVLVRAQYIHADTSSFTQFEKGFDFSKNEPIGMFMDIDSHGNDEITQFKRRFNSSLSGSTNKWSFVDTSYFKIVELEVGLSYTRLEVKPPSESVLKNYPQIKEGDRDVIQFHSTGIILIDVTVLRNQVKDKDIGIGYRIGGSALKLTSKACIFFRDNRKGIYFGLLYGLQDLMIQGDYIPGESSSGAAAGRRLQSPIVGTELRLENKLMDVRLSGDYVLNSYIERAWFNGHVLFKINRVAAGFEYHEIFGGGFQLKFSQRYLRSIERTPKFQWLDVSLSLLWPREEDYYLFHTFRYGINKSWKLSVTFYPF